MIYKLIVRLIPWVLVVILLAFFYLDQVDFGKRISGQKETYVSSILTRTEELGKLELARYNFQEVTEIKKLADSLDLKFLKLQIYGSDAKGVLISQGHATGCIDLTLIQPGDLRTKNDTLYIQLPAPELCYFKIDLEKSRLYDLKTGSLSEEDRRKFIQQLYKTAEEEIKNAALQTGILEQTQANAKRILKPLFESISGKKVVLQFKMDTEIIDSY